MYETAGVLPLSAVLLERQLGLFGDVARREIEDPMRTAVLQADALKPREPVGARRQGRPRKTWVGEMHGHALAIAGSQEALESLVRNKAVKTYSASLEKGRSAG